MRFNGIPKTLRRVRKEVNDLGFGTKIVSGGHRLINKDGSFNITRKGDHGAHLYQFLVETSWIRFFGIVILFYMGVNAIFGLLFLINGIESLPGAKGDNLFHQFFEAFHFSVQTFTTVGYGAISPDGFIANMLATFDALTGLMFLALATGLFFARFSKPQAQIIFSQKAIIAPYNGMKSFQFRIANTRNNKLIDVEAQVTMTWIEKQEDVSVRKFSALKLEREKIFLFPLNWNVVHPIDRNSPLFEKTIANLHDIHAEFLVLIKGYDESYAQQVHASSSYTDDEVTEARKFSPMYHSNDKRGTVLNLDSIDEIIY